MGDVDGVPYSHNLASGIVVVGSGLVSNDKRDTFKLNVQGTLEAQLRSRPKFMELAAVAAAVCGASTSTEAMTAMPATEVAQQQPVAQQPVVQQPMAQLPAAQQPMAPSQQPMATHRPETVAAAQQATAQAATAERAVIFGGSRRQAVPVQCGDHGAFRPALLESDLGVAWELGRGNRAESELEKSSKAAAAQYEEKQRAAIAARKESTKRNRDEHGKPCVCEVEALRETVQLQQQTIKACEKMQKMTGPLVRWLQKAAHGPQADES